MEIKIGEKIKSLRKQKNISQEVLAQYLAVSFQAVSKWENGIAMPDITLIPAIASFFGVSTDELFDFNLFEIEQSVMKICREAYELRKKGDMRDAEQLLRDGLKSYPGNDIILNNLLYTMRSPDRNAEVVSLCKTLIESTKYDDIKYDALRILAETYKAMGEYELTKSTIAEIPEIYFSKLELDATLLEGDDMYEAAHRQKDLSACCCIDMLMRLVEYYNEKQEIENAKTQLRIAKGVIEAFKHDIKPEFFSSTLYEDKQELLISINTQLEAEGS